MTWPGRISVGSVMWLMPLQHLERRAELERRSRSACRRTSPCSAGGSVRPSASASAWASPRTGRRTPWAMRTGDGVACRRRRHDREARGGRRRLPRAGVDGDDVRATISSRKATTISAISAAWPPTRVRDPLSAEQPSLGFEDEQRRAGRGPQGAARRRAPARARSQSWSRAPGRRGTWHRSGVRRRGTAGAASRASAGLRARRRHSGARGSRARSAMSRRRRRDTGRRP